MADYLDPVVAQFVGDNSDLLATIAESQGAMSEFAETAPGLGQSNLQAPEAATAAGEQAGEEFGQAFVEQAGNEIEANGEQELAGVESEALAASQQELAGSLGESAEAAETATAATEGLGEAATVTGLSAQNLAASFTAFQNEAANAAAETQQETQYLSQLAAQMGDAATQSKAAEAATKDAGDAAKDASVSWMALAIAGAAVEVGIGTGVLGLSAAMVGISYLLADFGGEAKGDLQEVEDAFRSTATQAAASFAPAAQEITQTLTGMVQSVEQPMAEMFQAISGPVEDFFDGLATSVEQGMDAMVPAVEQMGPLIASISTDLGPLAQGVAGFMQEMAAAFEAGGGQQELAQLASEIGQLLPVVGQLVGEVGAGLLPIAEALTPVLTAVGNVLNELGPNFDTLVGVVLLGAEAFKILSPVLDLVDQGVGLVMSVTAEYTGQLAEQAALAGVAAAGNEELATTTTEAGTAAGTAAPEFEAMAVGVEAEGVAAGEAAATNEIAATATEAAGVAADEAAFSIGALAVEFIPLVAAVALATFAGYELVSNWSTIASFFSNLGSEMLGFGEDVVNGFVQGIESAWQTAIQPVEDLIDGVKNAFTSALGIFSPSTVTREYGLNTGQGFALGLNDSMDLVHGGAASLAAAAASGLGGATAGGAAIGGAGALGSSAQGAMQVTINITQPLGTPAEIEAAIMPVIQQLNLRNGTDMATLPTTGGRTP